jgi:hypothetical protein
MELAYLLSKRHNLCVRTYPDECTKIFFENFSVSYESGYEW